MSLTPEQIDRARAMRAETPPRHWRAIANELKVTEHSLRCTIQPGYREYRHRLVRAIQCGLTPPRMPDELRTNARGRTVHLYDGERAVAPPEVIAERDRLAAYEAPSITAALCGDPPPWRSALAQKQLRLVR